MKSTGYTHHPLFWLVLFVRVAAAVYIFINPLWGTIWTLVLDYFDSWIWVQYLKMSLHAYHVFDKKIDMLGYICMTIVSIPVGWEVFLLLVGLLLYRFVGFLIYLKVKNPLLFLLFPNMFEVAFFWFVLSGYVNVSISAPGMWKWLLVLIIGKELQELWIHYPGDIGLRRFGQPVIFRLLGYNKKPPIEY